MKNWFILLGIFIAILKIVYELIKVSSLAVVVFTAHIRLFSSEKMPKRVGKWKNGRKSAQ